MKGSTLHRSGLTREKMGVLANLTQADRKQSTRAQLNQYYKAAKAQELDILWGSVQKGIQKVHNVTKNTQQKSPAAYLTIGFIAGVLFMCCIFLIVSITPSAGSCVVVSSIVCSSGWVCYTSTSGVVCSYKLSEVVEIVGEGRQVYL